MAITPRSNLIAQDDGSTPLNSRRKFRRKDSQQDLSEEDEDQASIMSSSSDHEMDALDAHVEQDEEIGLSSEERRKFVRNARRKNELGARIAGVAGRPSSVTEVKSADQRVIKRILVNALLIAAWYLFSLSISLVSNYSSLVAGEKGTDMTAVQQMDVWVQGSQLPLSPLHHLLAHGGAVRLLLTHSLDVPLSKTVNLETLPRPSQAVLGHHPAQIL